MLKCFQSIHINTFLPTLKTSCYSRSFSQLRAPVCLAPSHGLFRDDRLLKNDYQKRYYNIRDSYLVTKAVELQETIFNGISNSTIVHYAQESITFIHDTTGLEWGPTIVLSAFLLRFTLTFPLTIYQHYVLSKFENVLTDKFPKILEELKKETAMAFKMYNWSNEKANYHYSKSAKKQYEKMLVEENCHPFKASVLVLVQLPLWVSTSFAIRNLISMRPEQTLDAMQRFAELSTEKFGWLTDLSQIDHSLILPIALGITNLAIVELQVLYKDEKLVGTKKYITNVFRLIALMIVPLAASVPSALSLYWATSSIYGLGQNLLLISPKFKKMCGIPFTKKTRYLPYRHIIETIVKRYNILEKGK